MKTQDKLESIVGSYMAIRDIMPKHIARMIQQDLLKYAPEETRKIQNEINMRRASAN